MGANHPAAGVQEADPLELPPPRYLTVGPEPVSPEPAGLSPEPVDLGSALAEVRPPEPPRNEDGDSGYRGRRRLRTTPFRLWSPTTQRRASIVAVAVGVVLVGVSLAARMLAAEPAQVVGPPPSPPPTVLPDPVERSAGLGTAPDPEIPAPTPSAPAPVEVPADSYEAEVGGLGSHAQVVEVAGASGGQAVRLGGNRDGAFVELAGVLAGAAGSYQLTIFYTAEQERAGSVAVNGGAPLAVTFPARAAGSIGTVTLSVALVAGANTITIASSGGAPLVVDRLTVS